jgi:predicted alpha/beta-hydrolase family hydrolase
VTTSTRRLGLPVPDEAVDSVSAVLHLPTSVTGPSFLLLPGAGGDLDSPPLVALADAIAAEGHRVVRANLPYREAGRNSPPRADRAVPGYRAVLASARAEVDPDGPWVAGGKSYGGRVASLGVAGHRDVIGLIFYGYPLHPPGKPEKLRVDHWPDVDVPCLFLEGTRDTFGGAAVLEEHRTKLPRRATVHVVEGGDHSLKVARAASPDGVARAAEETVAGLGPVVSRWAAGLRD